MRDVESSEKELTKMIITEKDRRELEEEQMQIHHLKNRLKMFIKTNIWCHQIIDYRCDNGKKKNS
jgi:hypothetical protein